MAACTLQPATSHSEAGAHRRVSGATTVAGALSALSPAVACCRKRVRKAGEALAAAEGSNSSEADPSDLDDLPDDPQVQLEGWAPAGPDAAAWQQGGSWHLAVSSAKA